MRVQPLSEVPTPESVSDTVEEAIHRALQQRPDLEAQAAELRLGEAERQQARAAYYPSLSVTAGPSAQSLYIEQQNLPWGHTAGLTGGLTASLNWTVFDGGARGGRLPQNLEIRHHTDGMLSAESIDLWGGKVPGVSGAQDIRLAVRGRVQGRIVGWIGQRDRLDYNGFNELSGIREIPREARRFGGRDPISRLDPRIEQNPFDLVENETRQNQRMRSQGNIQA
jgi:hypothetical protein